MSPLLPSLWDRLLNPDALGAGDGVAAAVEAVRRDLEDLLNSREPADELLAPFPELRRSVYCYGVPELVSRPAASAAQRLALGRLIAEAVERHEPRLRGVRAEPIGDQPGRDRTLKFLISGTLRLDPAPGVEFETVVRLSTGQASVAVRS